jgi:hypothetical protein
MENMIPKWAESPPVGTSLFTPEQIAEVRAITQLHSPNPKESAPIRETIKIKRKKHGG